MFENLNFGEDFRNISIFDKNLRKSQFWSKFSNHPDFGQIFEKPQVISNFRKIRILGNFF